MPYCIHCGAQVPEGARFCGACGQPVAQVGQAAAPGQGMAPPEEVAPMPAVPPVAAPKAALKGGTPQTLLIAAIALYGVGALLTVIGGNMIGFLVCLLMVALIYFMAYAPFSKGQKDAAANGVVIAAVISLVLGFVDIFWLDPFAAIFNFVVAAILGLAWKQIKG